jgi:hypothetical protein
MFLVSLSTFRLIVRLMPTIAYREAECAYEVYPQGDIQYNATDDEIRSQKGERGTISGGSGGEYSLPVKYIKTLGKKVKQAIIRYSMIGKTNATKFIPISNSEGRKSVSPPVV